VHLKNTCSDFVLRLISVGLTFGVIEVRSRCEATGDQIDVRAQFRGRDKHEYQYAFGGSLDSDWGYIDHDLLHAGMLGEPGPLRLQDRRLVDETLDEIRHIVQVQGLSDLFGLPLLAMVLTPGVRATSKGCELIANCLPMTDWVTFFQVVSNDEEGHPSKLDEVELEQMLAEAFEECFAVDPEFSATVLAPLISLLPFGLTSVRMRFMDLDYADALVLSLLNSATSPEVIAAVDEVSPRQDALWGELSMCEARADLTQNFSTTTDPFPATPTEQFPNVNGLLVLCEEVMADPVLEGSSETLEALLLFHHLAMLKIAVERELCVITEEVLSAIVQWEAQCLLQTVNLQTSPPLNHEVVEIVNGIRDSWAVTLA